MSPIRYLICKYFVLFHWLSFHFLNGAQKVFPLLRCSVTYPYYVRSRAHLLSALISVGYVSRTGISESWGKCVSFNS